MKTVKLVVFCLLSLFSASCNSFKEMTNEEVIKQVNECRDNGLDYEILTNGMTKTAFKVNCLHSKQ